MPLRATSGPDLVKRSAKVGDVVEVRAKVENSTAAPETIGLYVEDLHEGALRREVTHAFVFEPVAAEVPRKSRASLSFTWRATLPEGKDAHTFRGRLVLRTPAGRLVGESPLDLYVSRS